LIEVKDKEMTADEKYYGICTTCNNAPHCANAKDGEHPVWFCEMFDDSVPSPEVVWESRDDQQYNSELNSKDAENNHERLKGLCINCALRETCKFPKPEGGVWHCAEYQ
jgi:hypothetical protein